MSEESEKRGKGSDTKFEWEINNVPNLAEIQIIHPFKGFVVGESGTGKTGALESLIKAGFRVVIIDTDSNLGFLLTKLRKDPNYKRFAPNVYYETCTDLCRILPDGRVIPQPRGEMVFPRITRLLDNWPGLGSYVTWGMDTVLVIDSLWSFANALLLYYKSMNPNRATFYLIGDVLEPLRAFLSNLRDINCNVIVITHVTTVEFTQEGTIAGLKEKTKAQEERNGPDLETRLYPAAIGRAILPELPRYFPTMLEARLKGKGPSIRRIISARPTSSLGVKCAVPVEDLPVEMPIATALRTVFEKAGIPIPGLNDKTKGENKADKKIEKPTIELKTASKTQ